jgi:hypothetical protein
VTRWSNHRRFRVSRDTILFTVGLLGIAYETLVDKADRPTLLILFAAMVGLPAFLRADEARDRPTTPPDPVKADPPPPEGGKP